ncbi:MAG TPA: GtrA family protein [Candidatus Saccharimonadales bacterium]|jgi:putative flippase GtrA|nr:GtrA family protein [Candidatus Saccharimonadales bacterium]
MKTKFIKALHGPFGRYLVIGVSVYIFELLVIFAAQSVGANPIVAIGLSFWLGLMVSFLLQKLVTFRDRRMQHRVVLSQLLAVTGLVVFNFGFTLIVAELLRHIVPAVFSRTVALGVTTIWNFYLYKTRIFKSSDELVY